MSDEGTAAGNRTTMTRVGVAALFVVALRLIYWLAALWARFRLTVDPRLMQANAGPGFGGVAALDANPWRYAITGVWERFDSIWYLHLAGHGYDQPASTIFYPLYPALIHLVSWLIHPPIAAALLVSTTATFFSVWGLQALLELDYPRPLVLRCVLLLAVWPASFSLFIPYADSLVLSCTVWSLYFARKDRWLLAGLLGFGGGLAKAVGCLVAAPLAYLAFRGFRGGRVSAQDLRKLLCAGLPLLGPLLFAAWIHGQGFPPASATYALYWKTHVASPWSTLAQAGRQMTQPGDALLALNAVLLLLAACAVLHRRVRAEYKLYAALTAVLFLTKSTDPLLQSTDRYVLAIFPAYLGVALAAERRTLLFGVVCCLFALLNAMLLKAYFGWSLVV